MKEINEPGDAPEAPGTIAPFERAPDTRMFHGADMAPSAAGASWNRVVDAAHDRVDRFDESAAYDVGRMGENVVEGLRSTVSRHPLAAAAAALVLGAMIVRVTR